MIDQIKTRLQALDPIALDLIDESALHAGHQGNGGGGHYKLNITSSHFCGKSQIMRHRLVYQALADLMPHKIHALSIHAIATDEV
ncbi:BolA family protein [Methylotenera sp.]|uniref:BolA family protein n=1 Tax=Methylotenera sp. TaxID=2051956 RepID=UPI002ED89D72